MLIQSQDWIQNYPVQFQRLDIISNSFVLDVTPNPPIQTGLDFKSSQLDPVEVKPRTRSNCEDLKSGPVRIGGFEILHEFPYNN